MTDRANHAPESMDAFPASHTTGRRPSIDLLAVSDVYSCHALQLTVVAELGSRFGTWRRHVSPVNQTIAHWLGTETWIRGKRECGARML